MSRLFDMNRCVSTIFALPIIGFGHKVDSLEYCLELESQKFCTQLSDWLEAVTYSEIAGFSINATGKLIPGNTHIQLGFCRGWNINLEID